MYWKSQLKRVKKAKGKRCKIKEKEQIGTSEKPSEICNANGNFEKCKPKIETGSHH